jgi:hypothetical protein
VRLSYRNNCCNAEEPSERNKGSTSPGNEDCDCSCCWCGLGETAAAKSGDVIVVGRCCGGELSPPTAPEGEGDGDAEEEGIERADCGEADGEAMAAATGFQTQGTGCK